jgi:predicted negative regulator of RcsB-dependent stress response
MYLLLGVTYTSWAQIMAGATHDGQKMYEQAIAAFKVKSYASAINLMKLCVGYEPQNSVFHRELARAYMLNGDKNLAAYLIDKTLLLETADELCYIQACDIYMQMSQFDKARKSINSGIEKYPTSGWLYEHKGNLYFIFEKDDEALSLWEKGIQIDPLHASNYYYAAKQEILVNENLLKSCILAETFLLMEPFGARANEMKRLLFDAYTVLYSRMYDPSSNKKKQSSDKFQDNLFRLYNANKYILLGGINDNNIIMLRMRFLIDYRAHYQEQYPFELFDFLQILIAEGHFEAYNHWIFGAYVSEERNNRWRTENATALQYFIDYIAEHKLAPKHGQYYFK